MRQQLLVMEIHPPRVTRDRARGIRDVLERGLAGRNPEHAPELTAIAQQFPGADHLYFTLHSGWDLRECKPVDFVGKRALEQLREIGRFVAALEGRR